MTKNELLKKINFGKLSGAKAKISKDLNISQAAITNWFSGKNYPTEENLKQISKLYKIDIEVLRHLFYDDNGNNFFANTGNIADNKSQITVNESGSNYEITIIKKDIELLKKEVEILKLKINK